ncbi:MAG: aminotransferase class V-fold PLP-dependent enzyme [Ferruginibacter sp.]|nr:aminotransferase class V-fold PLP-dependent enzyme [Ferruginibacter sp.]
MQQNNLKEQFLLRNDITFLNFGSFGACVKPVFEKYQQFQLELEQEPVEFIANKSLEYLKLSRQTLGNYIHCHQDDLVFIPNPSYAVNIIAKSLKLQVGDEILTTNLEYGACDKTWKYYCQQSGAKYVQQPIILPLQSKEDFVTQFFKGLTNKTKLIFISHITSTTGLLLPVEEICKIAKEKGILTFIDGAHAPGQVPLNVSTLQADIYTGACHKWMMTPKGSSFLYVKKELQHLFDPLVVSWGYDSATPSHSQFLDYHQTQGTRDVSAFLCIPAAIQFMQQNNWWLVSDKCQQLTQANANEFCSILNAEKIAPINNDFIVQLYSAPIKTKEPLKLKQYLYENYKIQIPVMPHNDKVYLRYSIQAFNSQSDLDKLFCAIKDIKAKTNLLEN